MPLDFANENWIRVYKRDTVTLKLLSWQSRALLWEMLRKADRAGVIDVGTHAERGIAVIVSMPLDVVSAGLRELLETGTVISCDGCFVFPKFIEAQETPASDKKRASDLRERRRDTALHGVTARDTALHGVTLRDETVTKSDAPITKSDETVTERHAASRRVTKEEKDNKEDISLSASRKKTPLLPIPENWHPEESHQQLAREQNKNITLEAERFRDWAIANAARKADWSATFRNWLRNGKYSSGASPTKSTIRFIPVAT